MTDLEAIYDEDYFAKRIGGAWQADSHSLARAVDLEFAPDSVVDLGCAVGHELEWFQRRGVRVLGIDGHPAAIEQSPLSKGSIQQHDLTVPFEAGSFDVALCIEVAEHLEEQHAETLVATCDRAADGPVVFTAAPPDAGGGTHHVNEQPRDYWKDLFAARGREYDAPATDRLRELVTVVRKRWIPPRLFVFR